VLITSRERLGTLDAANRRLDALASEAAIRLLGELAGADRASAEPQAMAEVARQCGYLPLALRIAGARLSARDPHPGRVQALADRLADERTCLDELELADLAVRSSFQVSYQALAASTDKRERSAAGMFRLLGLHQGPDIGVRAAAALLDASPSAAEAALERLVDAQLLESPAPSRYRMHDLLLLFSRERADQDEPAAQRDAACGRMLHFYLGPAQRQPPSPTSRPRRRQTATCSLAPAAPARPRGGIRLVRGRTRQPARRRTPGRRRARRRRPTRRRIHPGDLLVLLDADLLA